VNVEEWQDSEDVAKTEKNVEKDAKNVKSAMKKEMDQNNSSISRQYLAATKAVAKSESRKRVDSPSAMS